MYMKTVVIEIFNLKYNHKKFIKFTKHSIDRRLELPLINIDMTRINDFSSKILNG